MMPDTYGRYIGINRMAQQSSTTALWVAVAFAALAAVFSGLVFLSQSGGVDSGDVNWQEQLDQAVELQNNKLYGAAIDEYADLLDISAVPAEKRANYAYTIGQIYQDDLGDYENAAAYYVRAQAIGPRPELEDQITLRLVECYENLGRSFDAARKVAGSTAEDDSQKPTEPGTVVARIGDREITMTEVERELQKLPVPLQKEFSPPEKKLEFLRQYIGMELLYKSGLRRGIDRQPAVMAQIADAKRQLVIDEILRTEILDKIDVSEADLDLFYQAHKQDLFEGKPKEEVQSQLQQEYMRLKQREKYTEMIDNLISAEPVEIYEQNIK